MSEFHDPELRQELGRLSGPYPDENAAFAAWQRRVGQARRRRAMAWTTGAAMSVIVGVVAAAAMQGQNQHSVVPEKATETTVNTSTTVATTVATTIVKMVVTESTDESTSTTDTTLPSNTTPSSEDVVITMPPPETGDAGGAVPVVTTHKAKPGSGGGTTATPTTPSTPNTDNNDSHGVNKTITSIGGTITVHQFGDHLAIVDITPADGFHGHESGHSGQGIGVTFTSATHRSEISVWIDNGTLKNFVSEKNDTHGGSGPGDTSGDGYHGD
ncbi:MAG TPA: hypothetical protein VHN36_12740 [Ilumatobacteraceae bacterium]|nr:hypothetical protein [Ilumatobacteraceae bacterium]